MNAMDLVRRLHQHRSWVNQKLLDAADLLSTEQLTRPFPLGQGSVWKSLTHLYAAEYAWLASLLGDETSTVPGDLTGKLPGNQEGPGAMASLAELRGKWTALETRWREYLDRLAPESLAEVIYKVSSAGGPPKATRRADVLLHVCTHAQYTTAQLINMLRHAGAATLPDVMLISLAREESAARPMP